MEIGREREWNGTMTVDELGFIKAQKRLAVRGMIQKGWKDLITMCSFLLGRKQDNILAHLPGSSKITGCFFLSFRDPTNSRKWSPEEN